jgi:hypothetical protein
MRLSESELVNEIEAFSPQRRTGPVAQTEESRYRPFFPARTTGEQRSVSIWEMSAS